MTFTALLIVGLTVAGERFGTTVAGVLAALPIVASVLAVFTHARHGRDALVAMLCGMLGGLGTFVSFCALIALLAEPAGVIPAFVLATGAALLVQLMVVVLLISKDSRSAADGVSQGAVRNREPATRRWNTRRGNLAERSESFSVRAPEPQPSSTTTKPKLKTSRIQRKLRPGRAITRRVTRARDAGHSHPRRKGGR